MPERDLQRQLDFAGKIQTSMLPEFVPAIKGYDIGARLRQAQEIGGDFYYFMPLLSGAGKTAYIIADVMDKGLPAAVYALATLSKIHSILSLYSRATPEKTLMELNLELRHLIKEDTYITAQIVEIDSDLHTVKYAVMGHPPMIAMGMDGNSLLDRVSDSQPLNMVDDPDIAFGRFGLPPGALIALYTDGITEQHDSNDIYFGLPKLTNLLREYRHCPAQKICDLVMDRVDEFCDGIPPSDDRTIMVIKRNHS